LGASFLDFSHINITNLSKQCEQAELTCFPLFPHIIDVSLAFKTNATVKMAQQQQIPMFKLVLVGDGGTGKVMLTQNRKAFSSKQNTCPELVG
jgi:hypothetical protein